VWPRSAQVSAAIGSFAAALATCTRSNKRYKEIVRQVAKFRWGAGVNSTEQLVSSEFFFPASVYAALTLLTWFHLLRYGRPGIGRRALQLTVSAVWPLYWALVIGPVGTFTTVTSVISRLVPVLVLFWLLGLGIYPIYFVSYRGSSAQSCSDRWIEGIKSAPLWPLKLYEKSGS
jgi:hypothetical protein